MARQDIIMEDVDSKHDLKISNGDFSIGVSDTQHVRHILEASQGQYKQYPLIGVDVRSMLNSNMNQSTKRVIGLQLNADGYRPVLISVNDGIRIEL